MASDHGSVVEVEATVQARDATRPPRITLSFPGLQDPLQLWHELEKLGWKIPDRPPHPDAEIDWESPDGSRYHVLPYRVEDFEIHAEKWPRSIVAERGLETVNLLRRMGVDLNVPIAYLDFLRRTQLQLMKNPGRSKPAVRKPTDISVYETATGPSQPNLYWAESQRSLTELGRSEEDRDRLVNSIEMGWELVSRMEAPAALDGEDRILRFLVRDVRDGTAIIEQLKENVGDQCASLLMRPIERTGAFENCILIVAAVPSERFTEIGQMLIKNFPDAIGRARRYTEASEAAA